MNTPQKIIVHHSLSEDNFNLENFTAIRNYHIKVKGWSDIGYHWVLELVNGKYVWKQGRKENEVGAQCKERGMNHKSIGICVVGNFDKDTPTDEVYRLVADKCNEIVKRYPGIKASDVEPHHKYATYKSCPGKNFDLANVVKFMVQPTPSRASVLTPIKLPEAILRKGDKGILVKLLQQAMNHFKIHLVEDGDYGDKTEQAVKNFQKSVGITADGIYGPLTRSFMAKKLR